MSKIEAFWQAYLASLPEHQRPDLPAYDAWDFGNTKELADELGQLVRMGVKTATSMLVWELEQSGEKFPYVGEIGVVTDGSGEPLCIIEIIEVEIKPFHTIDEAFAFDYGEGDRSLAWWRSAMWEDYAAECQALGREPSETMPLVCQRFRLLYRAD